MSTRSRRQTVIAFSIAYTRAIRSVNKRELPEVCSSSSGSTETAGSSKPWRVAPDELGESLKSRIGPRGAGQVDANQVSTSPCRASEWRRNLTFYREPVNWITPVTRPSAENGASTRARTGTECIRGTLFFRRVAKLESRMSALTQVNFERKSINAPFKER